jgi:hypothetical protein
MSHITPLKTAITRLDCLSVACEKLGLTLEQGQGLTVTDYYGHSVAVAARIPLGRYSLGFEREQDGTLRMVADFWGIAKYCDTPKIRAACAGTTGSVDQIQSYASQAIAQLLDRPYNVAVAEATIAEQYSDCEAKYTYNEEGEVESIVLVRRRY